MKTKKGWKIFVLVSLGVSLALCGGLIYYLQNSIFANPEIVILQPERIMTIDLSEGIAFTVMARSDDDLHHVDFTINGKDTGKKYAQSNTTEEMLITFPWAPEKTGTYTAAFTAVGQNGRISEPAVMPVVVVSEGLSQSEVNASLAQAETIGIAHAAGGDGRGGTSDAGNDSAADSADEIPDIGLEEQENDENDIPDVGFEEQGDGIPDNDFERPEVSDQPPEITFFDVSFERAGQGVDVEVMVTAVDDIGVDRIFIAAYSSVNQDIPIQVEHACGALSPCELTVPSFLADGADYNIIATAVDTIGQDSAGHNQLIELSGDAPAGEGPGIAEDAPNVNLPDAFLDGLAVNIDGVFQVNPIFDGRFIMVEEQPDIDGECVPTTFDDVRAEVISQDYANNSVPRMVLQLTIPPCMETDVEDPYIYAWIGDDRDQRHCPGPFTDETYENGAERTDTITLHYCGLGELEIIPVLQAADFSKTPGTPTSFVSQLCGVKRPDFVSLHTTSNCPQSERCLTVSWEIPVDFVERLPIDQIVLIEKEYEWYGINENMYTFLPTETSHFRPNVLPNRVYEYLIYSVSADGVKSQQHKINIRIPAPSADPNLTTFDWQETR